MTMSRAIQAARTGGLAGLAALVFVTLPVLVPAGQAQEREEDRRTWRGLFRIGADELEVRPMLGVLLDSGRDDLVAVVDVLDGSPAEEAGIVEGDIIHSVNGHELDEPLASADEGDLDPDLPLPEQRLRALMSEVTEGETVTLVVEREGERLTLAVVPEVLPPYAGLWPGSPETWEQWPEVRGWLPDEYEARRDRIRELSEQFRNEYRAYERAPPDTLRPYMDAILPGRWDVRWEGNRLGARGNHGLDLVELNPGLGAYFGTAEGILVADVEDDSPLGLRPGDVVAAVEGRVVDDIDELYRILGSYRADEEIAFRIFRDGAQTTVTGTIN
ncbi:MAG: PDZ domain-containing protein [Gemmatimonadetes bacterium]|nr:PDZ domain-containing protein [Gemmatimonadota bacterium]MYB98245.1 PDZ domain-containing protein [Gemmatimonadota bacterium]MYI46438.1 PDZ domain-containing protein [Gemmatimonadota bacterium]